MKEKDHFAHKSKSWDMNSKRVKNAKAIAESILKNIKLDSKMELMDFGAGTGLLTYFVAPKVRKIVAVDNSPSMLEQFREKSSEFLCETEIIRKDMSAETLDRKFDGIISSMTIHHLEDTATLFSKFYKMLNENGFIAIADLDSEDGTFHSEDTGVHHYGFDREVLKTIASDAGFGEIHFETVSIIKKPHRDFPVFLMTAIKTEDSGS
jgi:cyclopropane fatty-acyl-phospholipid synthase-like methyltransferase